jgi:nuclear GTP-binding protein
MVAKKRKSKRQTLQQKYKIIKRVKQHHKKLQKGVNLSTGKKKKDENHIPNEWPHKVQLMEEIQAAKDRMEAAKQLQKEKRAETIVSTIECMTVFNINILNM